MEAYAQRIINGLLKTNLASDSDEALRLLHQDIEVIGRTDRVIERDLWPVVWALCSVLERQFTGKIYINVGLKQPLGQPARLCDRCVFVEGGSDTECLKIFLGCTPISKDGQALIGDARGAGVRFGSLLTGNERATPAACFALAGYLGFAALARVVGIPPFRQDLTSPAMTLPYEANVHNGGIDGLTFLGLGHLGQAYLSLLYFQQKEIDVSDKVALLDGGNFEDGNWHTHVLIEDSSKWLGVAKATYISDRLRSWGLRPIADQMTLNWGWRRLSTHAETAILGFDNFPARRMAAAAGYTRLVEAGLGDSLVQPRLT